MNLLEPLENALETVRLRISQHTDTLRENENRTKAALIEPILQALGWDARDPGQVTGH